MHVPDAVSNTANISRQSVEQKEDVLSAGGKRSNVAGTNVISSDVAVAASDATNNNAFEATPRSEMTPAADIPIPSSPAAPSHRPQEPTYFSPKPMRLRPDQLPVPEDSVTSITPRSKSASHVYAPSQLTVAPNRGPLTPEQVLASAHAGERPEIHRDLSNTSSISNASTIRASDFNTFLQLSHSKSRDSSNFPNQAYSALQAQFHAPVNSPHFLRNRSSHPATHTIYQAQSSSQSSAHDEHRPTAEPPSRTGSTTSSPGLFTPKTSPHQLNFTAADLEGTYSGPWLHHTHRQAPKETHVADIEVDPISGRKIINQYEIIDELGRGMHGKVKLGRDLSDMDGRFVAIKIVDRYSKRKRLGKNNSHESKIKKEIAILKKARHPNIVGLLEVIDDPTLKKVYIVLEHVEMGEVRWRTEGAKEICMIEYRRCMREIDGVFENDAANIEDDQILHEAQARLKQEERRQWKKLHKQRLSDQGIQSWSLEHGNDEEDDFSSPNVSRVASAAKKLSDIHHGSDYHSEQPAGQVNEMPSLTEGETVQSSHDIHEADDIDSIGHTLEGTMYGAYEAGDLMRGRTPSVTGSVSSAGWEQDYESHIPEHYRFVPLLTIDGARRAFRDTVLGLEYLHYQGVIHRDIKPANLLQARDHHIKISDFGVSYLGKEKDEDIPFDESSEPDHDNIYVSVELAKTVGTPAFYAPELCLTDCDPDAPALPVTGQIDIWALGVTLYCLIFGRVPFYGNNTFVLMRMIAEDEVYIPHRRLKAVDENASSRPSSHGRLWQQPINSNKRLPHELEYEEVNDELRDLLRRMLTKNPKERMTLAEVKHSPWVVHGITNPARWVEETDPSRMEEGRKIEVSKEDVDVAVVPLTVIERAKSVARRGFEKLGVTFGMSSKRSHSRRRAKSTATAGSGEPSQPTSNASSSSTISQDARRQERRRPSLRPDESIFTALKASRDGEHPLSQSVSASPELKDDPEFYFGGDAPGSRSGSPVPAGPERTQTTMSGTGSIRTIRPGDLGLAAGASTFPALPSTPLERPSNSSLGGIFGGAKQKILRRVQSKEPKSGQLLGRASPVDRLLGGGEDAHGEPSLGFSNTIAAGMVNPPECLVDDFMSMSASSAQASPLSSRAPSISSHTPSITSAEHLRADYGSTEEGGLSRNSSLSSLSSRRPFPFRARSEIPPPMPTYLPLLGEATEEQRARPNTHSGNFFDDLFHRAKDEQVRKLILERDQKERPASAQIYGHHRNESTSTSAQDVARPPSPDNDVCFRQRSGLDLQKQFSPTDSLSEATILTGYPPHQPPPLIFSSSEDQLTQMSQSTSNPSIPSVLSANSKATIGKDDSANSSPHSDTSSTALQPRKLSQSQPTQAIPHHEDDVNYDGDHAVESEDSDSDSSFIMMTRHKSKKVGLSRSESISNAELSLHRARRATGNSSVKSVRSGSNNTMKKIRSHEDSEGDGDERGRSRRLSAS
ncbi:kinase-like protein [Tothia fuscella]|uniref:non-specific serine/threonine protein kinase n=1 Tax=Tothia fuscella TaxID=1048955 RepID=A0A9P4TU95_9PEZI|nr:kinase-like protein [Tothia fuscella]